MKVKSSILLWFVTLATFVLGLFLPNIVYMVQSKGLASSSQQYSVETVQLETTKSAPMSDILRLMSGEYETMSLENGNKLSKEEAYQSALEILTFMKEYGVNLAPHAYTAYKATPVLVFTQNAEDAAVIWECGLTNQDDGSLIVIRLDDETGKMLSFIYVGNEISIQNSDTTFTVLSASDWGKMCVEYYGFMSVEAKPLFLESREENHALKFDTLLFTDSDGEKLMLPYRLDHDTAQDDSKVTISYNYK